MAGERILVVEDNEKNMKLFRDVLTVTGITRWKRRPVRAPSRWRPSTCQISCSWTSSFRISTASRRWPGCVRTNARSIPVVALTAQAMHGDRERFLAAGFDGYVSKPIDIGELVDAVRKHCDGGGT